MDNLRRQHQNQNQNQNNNQLRGSLLLCSAVAKARRFFVFTLLAGRYDHLQLFSRRPKSGSLTLIRITEQAKANRQRSAVSPQLTKATWTMQSQLACSNNCSSSSFAYQTNATASICSRAESLLIANLPISRWLAKASVACATLRVACCCSW